MKSELQSSSEPLPNLAEVWQETLNWIPNAAQELQFNELYRGILIANQKLNLTRITQAQEFWEKHLWDSLRGVKDLIANPDSLQVIDIGTGAGFPGLPIAIARPDWQVTLVDSTAKKIGFIHTITPILNLTNIHPLVGRSEAIGQQPQHRKHYDISVVRAVATASVCAEYTLPLLKLGGMAILYRGNWTEEESQSLQLALEKLGGEITKIERFDTPISNSIRHCIWLQKISDTPSQYPRAIGVPTQKPL
jgi:16S rRNA (guanine527-N7)-methyltransferase